MKLFKKIFNHEYKELEKFKKIADQVIALDEEYLNFWELFAPFFLWKNCNLLKCLTILY